MIDIALPANGWLPRDHQMRLWRYLHEGGKRAIAVWHRRAGKDEICLHHAAVSAMQRIGNYCHCLPEYAQGRKAIWTAVNPHTGARRIDEAFPLALRANTNDQEMFIRLVNGSTWQVIGSDHYNTSIVGGSIAGIVFSEYALANPSAWAYCRPMLEENNGWAAFITTPRGRNHAYAMFQHAANAPGWFCELKTAEDTGALTRAQLDESLTEYCALYGADAGTAQFRQEYLCDWAAAVLGAFYAIEMAAVRAEGPRSRSRGAARPGGAPGLGFGRDRRYRNLVLSGAGRPDRAARLLQRVGRGAGALYRDDRAQGARARLEARHRVRAA